MKQHDEARARVTRLPNGLRVVTAAMPHRASVAVGIWVGTGSRFETAEANGAAHFIEHMLFKGTRRRSARKISEDVEGIGGYLNAFTSEENTCFHARAHHRRLDDLVDVLSDMFLNSRFSPGDITKERDVIKEEIAMYYDQPSQHVHEILNETVWPGQALGRPITGTARTLDGLNRARLLRHLTTHYVPASTVITASGQVEHEGFVRRIREAFPVKAAPGAPAFAAAVSSQERPGIRLHCRATEQTQVALGIRTCSRHDPRRHALRLLNAVLGENMSSRLFQVVREDHGLAYSIYSSISFWTDVGDLVISAGLEAGDVEPALRLILRELKTLAGRRIGKAEFRRAVDYVLGQIELGMESTENQMNALGEQTLAYGRTFSVSEIRETLARVTPEEVQSAARDFFRPERLNLALVTSRKSIRNLERVLGS